MFYENLQLCYHKRQKQWYDTTGTVAWSILMYTYIYIYSHIYTQGDDRAQIPEGTIGGNLKTIEDICRHSWRQCFKINKKISIGGNEIQTRTWSLNSLN